MRDGNNGWLIAIAHVLSCHRKKVHVLNNRAQMILLIIHAFSAKLYMLLGNRDRQNNLGACSLFHFIDYIIFKAT